MALLLVIAAACSGCSDKRENSSPVSIIRLADSELIESIESCAATSAPQAAGGAASIYMDSAFEWHLFAVPLELKDTRAPDPINLPDVLPKQRNRLLIVPDSGIAAIVSARPNMGVLLEFAGDFGPGGSLKVSVAGLSARLDLPGDNRAGALRQCLKRFAQNITDIELKKADEVFRGSVITKSETRALALMIYSRKGQKGWFERIRMSYPESGLEHKPGGPGAHGTSNAPDALVAATSLEGILRPSLLIPPGTKIAFKKIRLPEQPEFSCFLGQPVDAGDTLKVRVFAKDEEDTVHDIFSGHPDRVGGCWVKVDRNLAGLAGRTVRLFAACEKDTGDENDAVDAGSSVAALGSPLIRPGAGKRPENRMNVVLISLDTLRYDHLGCYGYDRPVSPNLDRMASEGALFRRAYAHAPYTLPSHASLFTSLYPSAHGAEREDGSLPGGARLLPEILAQNGYDTASFTGGGFVSHEFGFHRGFDLCCEVDPLGDRYMSGVPINIKKLRDGSMGSLPAAFSWIDEMRNRPFFLFLHTFMVHDYLPRKEHAEAFNKEQPGGLGADRKTVSRLRKKWLAENEISDVELAFLVNMYDASIRAADEMIGELLAHLDTLGIGDKTLVIVTSDHGEEFLDHGDMFHKNTLYEEMIRIPLIMRIPGADERAEINGCVRHVDIMPTVLDLLGIQPDRSFQGCSLLPLLNGEESGERFVFAEVDLPGCSRRKCVIRNGWKYIAGDTDEALTRPAASRVELFNVNNDPQEKNMLYEANPLIGNGLDSFLKSIEKKTEPLREKLNPGKTGSSALSPELLEMLRQQGYL